MVIPLMKLEVSSKNNIYQDLFSTGKGLRACLTRQVAHLLDISKQKTEKLSQIVEYIHQSSLLHDDVIDMSPTRRGQLSMWRQYSMKKAVLAGDYLLAESAETVAGLQNIPLVQLTAHTLKRLVKGEYLQAEIKNQKHTKDLEKVHELKTASLFQWSLKAPFLLKNYYGKDLHSHLHKIGCLMGLLFQRADDLLDFDIRNKEGKTVFKDLEEGVFNIFALHLINQNSPLKPQVLSALKSCRSLKEVKNLIGKKSFEKTLMDFDKISQQKIKACQKAIEQLGKTLLKLSCSPTTTSHKLSPLVKHPEKIKTLESILKEWTEKLYWRK